MKIIKSMGIAGGAEHRVFIAVPSYGNISSATFCSFFGAKEALLNNGIESELEVFDGNCHVDDSRNLLVRDFLESDCTEMVFIDSDVRFTPEDLVKLVLHDKDVVAGIYPLKQEDENYPVEFIQGEIWSDKNGLIEVEKVPTGFLKMKRNVLEQLYEKAVKFRVKQDHGYRKALAIIFERTVHGYTRYGGDFEFCRKWKKIGGKIYIDPEMTFGHAGSYEWSGRLGDFLRKKAGLDVVYINTLLNKIKKHEDVEQTIMRLVEAWGNKWSLLPETLQVIYEIAKEKGHSVLECGSGLSTLILGALGKKTISFENDLQWFDKVGSVVESYQSIDLRHIPIKDGWYDTLYYDENILFDFIICDGPVRKGNKRDRLADFIKGKLADKAIILIDDYCEDALSNKIKELGFKIHQMGTQRSYAIGIKE